MYKFFAARALDRETLPQHLPNASTRSGASVVSEAARREGAEAASGRNGSSLRDGLKAHER